MKRRAAWFLWSLAPIVVAACGDDDGGETNVDGEGSGGHLLTGGSSPSDGGSDSGGATGSGGMASGGAGTGGDAGGGDGSGGLPGHCSCELPSIIVCGIDGMPYDAGCGEDCVPVDIDCTGPCPCEGCGCQVTEGTGCDSGERQWLCDGTGFDDQNFQNAGCTALPPGSVRYCCPLEVVPSSFCVQ